MIVTIDKIAQDGTYALLTWRAVEAGVVTRGAGITRDTDVQAAAERMARESRVAPAGMVRPA